MLFYSLRRLGLARKTLAPTSQFTTQHYRAITSNTPQYAAHSAKPQHPKTDADPAMFEDHRRPWFFTINKLSNLFVLPGMRSCCLLSPISSHFPELQPYLSTPSSSMILARKSMCSVR